MAKRLAERLGRVVNIRPGEAALAVLFFLYFFLVTAPFNIIKSIRDASYLDELGARSLPYAYATAILIGAVVSLHSRLQARVSRKTLLLWSLAFFAATTALFGGLFAWSMAVGGGFRKWLPLPFYLWVNVFTVVLVTQFWFCVNDVFNPREAKRLIGFFGSGGILGGIAGGLVTGLLARPLRTSGLLFVSAGLLLACMAVVGLLFREQRRLGEPGPAGGPGADAATASKIGFGSCWDAVRADSYLKLLAAVVFVGGVVSTLIDWEAKTVIADKVLSGRRTEFFGMLNAGLLVLAFLFQLVLTSRVIDRFGLRRGLMIYPVLLLLGAGGIALAPALAVAVVLKGADKALSYSISQSARELLYIPVPQSLKYRAKAFIDMFVNRFSRVAGAMLLFALFLPFGGDSKKAWLWVIGLTGAAIIAWIVLNLRIGRAYVQTIKDQLGRTWERGDEVVGGEIDVETAKLIVDALESKSRSSTLYALHLFELLRSGRMTPEVGGLLAMGVSDAAAPTRNPMWESDEVPWMPDLAEALPAEVLDRNIREIMALPDYRALMGDYARRISDDPAAASLTAKMELAKAAGLMGPDAPAALSLVDLLREDSPEVIRYAAASAGTLGKREFVAPLVAKLGDPRTREDARSALEEYGARIVGTLGDYLADPTTSEEIRREIAAILAPIATQSAADELLDQLRGGAGDLEADVIDGLDRIRVRSPEVVFPADVIEPMILKHAAAARAEKTSADPLILFKLIGLLYPHEDVFRAYRSYGKGTKDDIAYAVELLDEMLPRDLKEKIIPVLESADA
jgi:ATP/ADP translocase